MNLRLIFFGLVAAVQIGAPVSMIVNHEQALKHGRQFKFHTAPVDPYDAFRGRYVALQMTPNSVLTTGEFRRGQKIYLVLSEDESGFAQFERARAKRIPGDNILQAEAGYSSSGSVSVNLPFDRYYLEESAAPKAEAAYREHSRQGNQDAYVTVRIHKGVAALEELYVGGKPIREFLLSENKP